MEDDVPEIIQKTGCEVLWPYWYLFGGQGAYPALAYNLITETWEESTYPPIGSSDWNAVATDDAIYLVGRFSGQSGDEFQRFTPEEGGPEGRWTQLADYPLEACAIAAAWDGRNYIYAAGGANGFTLFDFAYRYDIAADIWEEIARMPTAFHYHGGAFLNGKFYCFGGIDTWSTLMEYDPLTDTWTQKADAPNPVFFAQSCVTQNDEYLFVVGGGGGYYIWPESDAVQIYDPDTDTWTVETPLPEAIGLNCADYVGDGAIMTTGGWIDMNFVYTTWKGLNFPGGTPPPVLDVTLDLSAAEPIMIPANGGSFDYTAVLSNNETGYAASEVWVMVRLPDGTWTEPILGPLFMNLPGGIVIERDRVQNVPAFAPAGSYLFEAYVGDYPDAIWDSDSIAFEKSAGFDGDDLVNNWLNSERVYSGVTAEIIPDNADLINAHPNPFNPTTVLSFQLQDASRVNLTVYDISGRKVAELVNGWRDAGLHEVTFVGSQLVSGIYVYRLQTGQFTASGKMVLMK
jgi:N-acetylneuraminic acid mutarotase